MDDYDRAQRAAGNSVKICPDCLEEWELCTCVEVCFFCGCEEPDCECEPEGDDE